MHDAVKGFFNLAFHMSLYTFIDIDKGNVNSAGTVLLIATLNT
jgi:hypothetical protein